VAASALDAGVRAEKLLDDNVKLYAKIRFLESYEAQAQQPRQVPEYLGKAHHGEFVRSGQRPAAGGDHARARATRDLAVAIDPDDVAVRQMVEHVQLPDGK
jgi:hypothetical protein